MIKLFIICGLLLFFSCGFYYQNGTNLDPKTNRFKAPDNGVRVLTEISVDADTLKSLLIVPYASAKEIAKNLDYFDEVMTDDQFEDAIIKAGFADEIGSIRNRNGLHRAAILFRPFVLFEHVYTQTGSKEGFRLYDPNREKIIFENEKNIGLFSPSNQARLFPLYNSLLDYLRKQH